MVIQVAVAFGSCPQKSSTFGLDVFIDGQRFLMLEGGKKTEVGWTKNPLVYVSWFGSVYAVLVVFRRFR